MDQVKFLEAVLPDLESGAFGQSECYYGLLLKKSPDGKPERRQSLVYSRLQLAQFLRARRLSAKISELERERKRKERQRRSGTAK